MITAKVKKVNQDHRIFQCDIFHDIEIVENIKQKSDGIDVTFLNFPLVICLNQDCDLNSDARDKVPESPTNKNCRLLHLIVAPLYNFDTFKEGTHWGDIFDIGERVKAKSTSATKIMNNEDPRYHYLSFENNDPFPDLIIDFKHFFTVSTDYMYSNKNKRVCSISEIYREKICQRFANYISRIGLPD